MVIGFKLDQGDQITVPPRKQTSSKAPPPDAAIIAKVSGTVVVELVVDEQGKVISAHAVSGHALLKGAAISAARQWTFEPMTLQGVPAKVVGTLSFVFK